MTLTRRGALALSAALAAPALPRGARAAGRDSVNLRINRDVANLDPANRTSFLEANIAKACMQRLIGPKRSSFETELDAADVLDPTDPLAIRFQLKEGLQFTGGYGAVTAEDVQFSFERFATAGPGGKAATRAKDWAALDRVEVTGPLTGVIRLKQPAPNLLTDVLPGGSGLICSRKAFAALGDGIRRTVVGSGPMMFESSEPGTRTVLRRNPDWRGTVAAQQHAGTTTAARQHAGTPTAAR